MLSWSLRAFEDVASIDSVMVVAHPESITAVAALCETFAKVDVIVPGGASRAASTRAALEAVPHDDGIVIVHDGARPAIEPRTVEDLVAVMRETDAATVAVPAHDTILQAEGATVSRVPDRATMWHAQTPQAFRLSLLRRAHRVALASGREFTDDCGVVLSYEPATKIQIVEGSRDNVKVTTPGDLEAAEAILERRA